MTPQSSQRYFLWSQKGGNGYSETQESRFFYLPVFLSFKYEVLAVYVWRRVYIVLRRKI